jgi:hypothetical protein
MRRRASPREGWLRTQLPRIVLVEIEQHRLAKQMIPICAIASLIEQRAPR